MRVLPFSRLLFSFSLLLFLHRAVGPFSFRAFDASNSAVTVTKPGITLEAGANSGKPSAVSFQPRPKFETSADS
jgi:hypothetical protein